MRKKRIIVRVRRAWRRLLKFWDACTKWMDRLKTVGFIITILAVGHDVKTGRDRDRAYKKIAEDSAKCIKQVRPFKK